MKTLFRLLVVFGILDLIVAGIELARGDNISAKIIAGVICLVIGGGGLIVIKTLRKS